MIREIKFRAWDKEGKRMSNDVIRSVDYGQDNKVSLNAFLKTEAFELMQFTGLKDKNGKEIWEGDIVRWYSETEYGKTAFEDEVEYLAGGFQCLLSMPSTEFEVIGNIYENKTR